MWCKSSNAGSASLPETGGYETGTTARARSRPLVRIQLGALCAVLAIALATLSVGCGSEDGGATDSQERNDLRPKLPAGWRRVVNRPAGFNLGVPRDWRARTADGSTLVRSHDRALSVSITADRTRDGRELGPGVYATRAARALEGYRGLHVGNARRVEQTRYLTAKVQATGVFEQTGLRQVIEVFAVSKRDRATFTVIFFRSARVPGRRYASVVKAIVRSLRSQRPA